MFLPPWILHGPVVAGAIAATGTYWKVPQNAYGYMRHLLLLLKSYKKSNSIRSRHRCELLLRSLVKTKTVDLRNLSTVVLDDPHEELNKVIEMCQVKREAFSTAVPFYKQKSALKLAEGSYAEIYLLRHADGSRRIFKCVPVCEQADSNDSKQVPLKLTLPDIVCSFYLSKLNEGPMYMAPNFPLVYRISLIRDQFPSAMMQCWWDYKSSPMRFNDPAEHPQPDLYREGQLFLGIESSYCGEPITRRSFRNAWVGLSVMTQLASALAIAEAAHYFEHRDLHLGNVLLKQTDCFQLQYALEELSFSVNTVGQQVFVIDFTFSRIFAGDQVYCVKLNQLASERSQDSDESGNVWLNHKSVYEIMAHCSSGLWDRVLPITNIIWLKYVNENILHSLERNLKVFPSFPVNFGEQERAIELLTEWNDAILHCSSASSLLHNVILLNNPLVTVNEPNGR